MTMTPEDKEEMNGVISDIADAFQKVLRPKNAEGETEPMGTVEVKLSKQAIMSLGGLLVGGIILNAAATAVTQNLKSK